MTLCLTNTVKRTKEPFAPANPDHVTMYVCGPTVYNFAHIGAWFSHGPRMRAELYDRS